MTGLLRETMREQVDAQTPPTIDVETLVRAGERRVRRSRLTTGLAAAGVAGILAIGTVLAPQLGGSTSTPGGGQVAGQGSEEVAAPFAERRPTYAVGGTIHYGDNAIRVGKPIESFVQTDDGFVFATADGEIHLADGETTENIGRTHRDGLYLEADDSGSLVAWMEFTTGKAPELVVYDTAERDEVARTDEGTRPEMQSFRDTDAAYVYAVDDGTVYWRNAEGVTALDVVTGRSELLLSGAGTFDIADVANGLFAHQMFEEENEGSTGLYVSTHLARPGQALPTGWSGYLSPDARYVAVDQADDAAVYDTATHADVTPDAAGYEFAAVYAWLDDTTLTMMAIEELGGAQPIDILECTVPKGTCTVAADDVSVYRESEPPSLALPVGQRLDDD
jgi:hypothetical protein